MLFKEFLKINRKKTGNPEKNRQRICRVNSQTRFSNSLIIRGMQLKQCTKYVTPTRREEKQKGN